MPVAEHLVATTRDGLVLQTEHAVWLWQHLRARLPTALSCVLMPNHVHTVALPGCHNPLRHLLTAFTARFKIRFDVLEPQPANSTAIAKRMMRYSFHNPVRAGYVSDPWCWPWSTLRDLASATVPIWTPLERIGKVLRGRPDTLLHSLTTTADSKPPVPEGDTVHVASLTTICTAIAVARRLPTAAAISDPLGRRLVVQACTRAGGPPRSSIARHVGISERTVRYHLEPRHPALASVLSCLADPRLHLPLEDALG